MSHAYKTIRVRHHTPRSHISMHVVASEGQFGQLSCEAEPWYSTVLAVPSSPHCLAASGVLLWSYPARSKAAPPVRLYTAVVACMFVVLHESQFPALPPIKLELHCYHSLAQP